MSGRMEKALGASFAQPVASTAEALALYESRRHPNSVESLLALLKEARPWLNEGEWYSDKTDLKAKIDAALALGEDGNQK